MNKGSIVERLCSDLDRKEPRYKSLTFTLLLHSSLFLFVCVCISIFLFPFYRAMHISAKRGLAIACRLSVRL